VPDTTEDLLSVLTEDTRGQQQLEGRGNIVDLKRDSHLEDLQLVLPALWNGRFVVDQLQNKDDLDLDGGQTYLPCSSST
jgi:hypothetical protein